MIDLIIWLALVILATYFIIRFLDYLYFDVAEREDTDKRKWWQR